MGETAISVESIATEYLRLYDEGWNPNIDEFLGRVPEEMREECKQRIQELAALNGLDLSVSAAPAAAEPEAEEQSLSQEITPEGDDASASSRRLKRTTVLDEMNSIAAEQSKTKPERRRGRRASEPVPEPLPEPAAAHEGIETLAAQESVDVPETFEQPAPVEQTETALVEAEGAGEAPPEPTSARRRSRDEPAYSMPARGAARDEPAKAKPPPKAKKQAIEPASQPALTAETRGQLLSRLRDACHLERHGAIPAVESDRLHVIYRRILDQQGASEDLPITLPHLALYAFVAAAVAGAGLFVACVHDASAALQALVPGAIFLTLFGAGIRAKVQGDSAGASLFLAAASVATAPAVVAGLSLAGLLGGAGALPAPLTNLRLLAGTCGGLVLAGGGFLLLRRGLLAWATAALAAAAYGALVITLGVQDLPAHEIALRFLPLVLLTVPGLLLESQGKVRWAMPFHMVALAALLGPIDVMALHGGLLKLVGLSSIAGPARLPYLGFAAAGLVLAVLSLALERARSFDLRRAARFLQLVAGLHLVAALGWNAAVNREAKDVGALGAASLIFLVLGRFHRKPLLVTGGIGLVLALCFAVIGGVAAPGSLALGLSGAGLLGALGIYFYLARRTA